MIDYNAAVTFSCSLMLSGLLSACFVPLSRRGAQAIDLILLYAGLIWTCMLFAGADLLTKGQLPRLVPPYAVSVGAGLGFMVAVVVIGILAQVDYGTIRSN